jgi:hypothetical protein
MSPSSPTIPAPSSAQEREFAAGLPQGRAAAPLKECYGRWRVLGPSLRDENGRYWAPCECTVHGTRRKIREADLRSGYAQRCALCYKETRKFNTVYRKRST